MAPRTLRRKSSHPRTCKATVGPRARVMGAREDPPPELLDMKYWPEPGSLGRKMRMAINSNSLLRDAAASDVPSTEDMREEDCLDFVSPSRRRNRQSQNGSLVVARDEPRQSDRARETTAIKSTFIKSPDRVVSTPRTSPRSNRSCNTGNHLFVGNIPHSADKQQLIDTFSEFGDIIEVVLFKKTPPVNSTGSHFHSTVPHFGFVVFSSSTSVDLVMTKSDVCLNEGPNRIPNHRLHVERRKDNRLHVMDRLAQKYTVSNSFQSCRGNTGTAIWHNLISRFNWKHAAAKYLFRMMTMEDYLVQYIHTLASYRQTQEEPIKRLMERLINLSESCPEEPIQIMPPSISGMVYNQTDYSKCNKKGRPFFDVCSILERSPDQFLIKHKQVHYLELSTKEEAITELRTILIEGTFIYFFARFCHGPTFKIKESFYQKSEPIKSVLLMLTGKGDVVEALLYFFEMLKEIFRFDRENSELSLTVDYFRKANREDMKQFLENQSALYEDEKCHDNSSSTSGNDSVLSDDFLDCFLAPIETAELKLLRRPVAPGYNSMPMPHNVQSVVEDVLLDDEDLKLLSNPLAIDNVINKLEYQVAGLTIERAPFKRRVEEQIRQLVAKLLQDIRSVEEKGRERQKD